MKSIDCINFVSHNAPNILLIACINNTFPAGTHLKYFKNTHNVYALKHNTDNNFSYYTNLPSKHNEILDELNKNNLYKFSIYSFSFGGIMAFYLIFHFKERISKVFVHDYYLNSIETTNIQHNKNLSLTYTNWSIPTYSTIPIIFDIYIDNYVDKKSINSLKLLFKNIIFILTPLNHLHSSLERKDITTKILFIFFNGITLKNINHKIYSSFICNKKLPFSFRFIPRNLMLKLFCLFYKH